MEKQYRRKLIASIAERKALIKEVYEFAVQLVKDLGLTPKLIGATGMKVEASLDKFEFSLESDTRPNGVSKISVTETEERGKTILTFQWRGLIFDPDCNATIIGLFPDSFGLSALREEMASKNEIVAKIRRREKLQNKKGNVQKLRQKMDARISDEAQRLAVVS